MPLDRALMIGRAPASDLRLQDPSVSRIHAQIIIDEHGITLQDAGSSYGTFVDGRQLAGALELSAGMRIELGDCALVVAERVDRAAAAHTMSVPAGISLIVEQPSVRRARLRGQGTRKPRLRSGWSLKRLDERRGKPRRTSSRTIGRRRSCAWRRQRPSSSSCSTAIAISWS